MVDIQLFIERQSVRLIRPDAHSKPDLQSVPTRLERAFSLSVRPNALLAEIRDEIRSQLMLPDAYSFLHPENGLPVSLAQESNDRSSLRMRDYLRHNGCIVIRIQGFIEGSPIEGLRESRSVEFKSLAQPVKRGVLPAKAVLDIIDRGSPQP